VSAAIEHVGSGGRGTLGIGGEFGIGVPNSAGAADWLGL
jgi:hypothetical protein